MSLFKFSAKEILGFRKNLLLEGGSPEDLDWLLDLEGGLSWSDLQLLYIDQDKTFKLEKSLKDLSNIWRKYLIDDIPLQYLVGKCSWRDFVLEVNSSVLIPRQETELLVDLALQEINVESQGEWVDLGTGSGAIAVSLARALPGWIGHVVDCNKECLALASRNLKLLAPNATCHFHLGNWWEPLSPFFGKIDLALSNPPYIPDSSFLSLSSQITNHEPHIALRGGSDGLACSRIIIHGARTALREGGLLLMENHFDQSEKVIELMNKSGLINACFAKDVEGVKRFAIAANP